MPESDGSRDPTVHTKDTWEVSAGKMLHRTESGKKQLLRKGDRFHPTLKQANDGSLENKARKVKDGGGPVGVTVGVDFDEEGNIVREDEAEEPAPDPDPEKTLDDLEWGSGAAKRRANEAGLSAADMKAVEPTGATGYVSSDVTRALEARDA